MGSHSNQLASYLIAWIIITFIGVILFLLPVVYDVQAAFTGFALFGIGVLFAGTGFGMTINYSVRILKQKFSEPKALPIVEWILSDEEWKQYCIQRLKYNLKSYLNLYYLVIASGLIIYVVLLFVLEEQTTIISFEYSTPYRRMSPLLANVKRNFVRVPVPLFEMSRATYIVNEFQKRINNTV